MLRAFTLLAGLLLAGGSPVQHVLDQLKMLHGNELSYQYSVSLVDRSTGAVLDSNAGRLLRSGGTFIDSNREFFTALNGQYYCKLDKSRKQASVYQLSTVKRKLGIDPLASQKGINITDSFGFKSPVPKIDTSGAGGYRFTWQLDAPTPSSFCIRVDKKTYKLLEVVIEAVEDVDREHSYLRICVIRDISTAATITPAVLSSIFRIVGSKVVMAPKYADYNVKSIID